MVYGLENECLAVGISDIGAEVVSVKAKKTGCEYLWQGDEKFWEGQAPLLFPICGRLPDARYTWRGKTFDMKIHGFAKDSLFTVRGEGTGSLVFTLASDEKTKAQYPFDFLFEVTYTLTENRLATKLCVKNTGEDPLPAVFGLHPGFNVPLDSGLAFEDYYLEFGDECSPDSFMFSDRYLLTGKKVPFNLENAKIIRCRRGLFEESIFLDRTPGCVTLKSDRDTKSVTLIYRDFPYLGFWNMPDAPYLCIEPWCGLPSYEAESEDFAQKPDMFRLLPGSEKSAGCDIIFGF